jgi:hypothetical protein
MPKDETVKVRIDPNLYQRLLYEKPKYLSITAFTNIVIDKGLDACDKLCEPAAQARGVAVGDRRTNKDINKERARDSYKTPSKKDPFKAKRLDPGVIPDELADCADQIVEFWAVKKGTRTEGAATRLFNKLHVMTPGDRIKALHAATDSGWASVFPPRDQPRTQSAGNIRDTPTETPHPAGKVFTASDVIGGAFN